MGNFISSIGKRLFNKETGKAAEAVSKKAETIDDYVVNKAQKEWKDNWKIIDRGGSGLNEFAENIGINGIKDENKLKQAVAADRMDHYKKRITDGPNAFDYMGFYGVKKKALGGAVGLGTIHMVMANHGQQSNAQLYDTNNTTGY